MRPEKFDMPVEWGVIRAMAKGMVNPLAGMLAAAGGDALHRSWKSIPKLQKYEEKAEKAANWSNAAERRLWDTRYTVVAGFVTVRVADFSVCHLPSYAELGVVLCSLTESGCTQSAVSVLTAIAFLFILDNGLFELALSFSLAAVNFCVARYMQSFWADKAKIPLMKDYNAAISDTVTVMNLMDVLAGGWVIFGVAKVFGRDIQSSTPGTG